MTIFSLLFSVGLALVMSISGCSFGSGGPPLYTVTGTVTLDGEPLKAGSIALISENGEGGAHGGRIRDGKFELKATSGVKLVRITAPLVVDAPPGQPADEAEVLELIPPEYNQKSTLKLTVNDSGITETTFELKGKLSP